MSVARRLNLIRVKIDWPSAARNVWLGAILGLAIHAFCLPFSHSVYDIYVGAARRWLAGEPIYVLARDYYRYSPLFAVALGPLAVLPDGASAAAWKIINCGVFALGLRAWASRLSPRPLSANEIAAQLLLAIPVALHSLYNGQANLMMLGSLLFGMAAAGEGKWNRAAMWIAWATLIKGYPLALAMILAVLFPRQFAGRFFASLAAGLLLPFATARPAVVVMQYQGWWHHLRDSTEIMRERLRSIDQLFVVCGDPLSERTFALLGALAGAAVLLVCISAARRCASRRDTVFWVFLWFSLWVLLFGPATEACTYVVAAPAIAWALVEAWHRHAWWPERGVLVASLLMMGPMVTDLFGKLIRDFSNEHGSQPVGGLLLLGWLIVEWRRSTSAGDGAAVSSTNGNKGPWQAKHVAGGAGSAA
ncbi:MAG TPA: glycosyltransferase family 87 protein [Pirellulales bacterium]|nr:glycosyltransferase family 87 protein [Pirellulales bacterium]